MALLERRSLVALTIVAGLATSLTFACSALLDAGVTQCSSDATCESRGIASGRCVDSVCVTSPPPDANAPDVVSDAAPSDPKWGCLGNTKWGTQDISQQVLLRRRYIRFLGEGPIAALRVTACGRLDPSCSAPVANAVTDDAGYANFNVPKYFEGFFAIDPPSTYPSMVPALVAVTPPPETSDDPDASTPSKYDLLVASNSDINALVGLTGASVDPTLSNVLGIALDCQGVATAGVAFRLEVRDAKTLSYYTDATGPSTTAQETGPRGEGGFVNVPTGIVSIMASVPGLAKAMGRYTVITKPGHITYLLMSPGPS